MVRPRIFGRASHAFRLDVAVVRGKVVLKTAGVMHITGSDSPCLRRERRGRQAVRS